MEFRIVTIVHFKDQLTKKRLTPSVPLRRSAKRDAG